MKKRSKKGFTLAELLIVIAIIAILVAIMFPVFGAQLTKARLAADLSNVRAAYSEEVADQMLGGTTLIPAGSDNEDFTITIQKSKLEAAVEYGSTVSFTPGSDGAEGTVTVTLGSYSQTFHTDADVTIE